MSSHPALAPGRVAVITGAASGIGFAAAKKFAALGMKVAMADLDPEATRAAAAEVAQLAREKDDVKGFAVDVSDLAAVVAFKDEVYATFGEVAVLMNNAGVGNGGGVFGDPRRWRRLIDVNLFGVVNGVQAFGPSMVAQKTPAAIVNTGSKQGITCPPGDTAYNVSKAGVKVVTEALAYELASTPGCEVSAHLLIPGFTFTAMTAGSRAQKPPGAWTPDQVVDFLIDSLAVGRFYVLCPDNDVTREIDEKRIRWAAEDIIFDRPALSRWRAEFKEAFDRYMKG